MENGGKMETAQPDVAQPDVQDRGKLNTLVYNAGYFKVKIEISYEATGECSTSLGEVIDYLEDVDSDEGGILKDIKFVQDPDVPFSEIFFEV